MWYSNSGGKKLSAKMKIKLFLHCSIKMDEKNSNMPKLWENTCLRWIYCWETTIKFLNSKCVVYRKCVYTRIFSPLNHKNWTISLKDHEKFVSRIPSKLSHPYPFLPWLKMIKCLSIYRTLLKLIHMLRFRVSQIYGETHAVVTQGICVITSLSVMMIFRQPSTAAPFASIVM